jgi:hypothetical protein
MAGLDLGTVEGPKNEKKRGRYHYCPVVNRTNSIG